MKKGIQKIYKEEKKKWGHVGKIPYYKPGKEYLFVKEDIDNFIHRQKRI